MSASESSTPRSGSDGQPTTEGRAPRLPRAEVTRQRLLEAGRELFAEYGPHEVTSQAIATRAGYASGTFYLYFKDKLALFRELAENAATELERRLQALEQDETDPYVIVKTQAEVLVGFAADQRDLLRIAFHPGSEAAGIGSGILEHLAEGVSQRRREALAAGLVGDCFDSDVLAQAIVGMWAHVLAWWAEDPSRASRDDIVKTLTHFQLHGNRAEVGIVCRLPETEDAR